ncbi:MAG: VOC family protein, partial [Caldimonas sp.]
PPVDFERPVMYEGELQRAVFTTVRIAPDHLSGGRVYFCEHKTPHLVWQPQWQRHANAALGLASFSIVVPAPAEEAPRYARLLGCAAQPERDGAMALTLGRFRIVLCTLDSYRVRYGSLGCSASLVAAHGAAPKRPAFMGSLSIRTSSLQAVLECLTQPEAADVQWSRSADRVTVSAASAGDCTIEFVE